MVYLGLSVPVSLGFRSKILLVICYHFKTLIFLLRPVLIAHLDKEAFKVTSLPRV